VEEGRGQGRIYQYVVLEGEHDEDYSVLRLPYELTGTYTRGNECILPPGMNDPTDFIPAVNGRTIDERKAFTGANRNYTIRGGELPW